MTAFDQVKVVILGQDPYHGVGQSHGLAFSVPDGVRVPPSLRNIYKELYNEWFANYRSWSPLIHDGKISGNLTRRAEQWVLLLNAILSVRASQAWSHRDIGREIFTDAIIKQISDQKNWVVFLLRGSFAQSKVSLIDESKHLILKSVHPSPLSAYRGWFGNNHFQKTNEYLQQHWKTPIEW